MTASRRHASFLVRLIFAILALIGLAGRAQAQTIDRIDIAPRGDDAEIRIGFSTQIQYQRHAPQSQGELLRVYIQRTAQAFAEQPVRETLPSPKSELVARFTVTYPETENTLLIKFARSTTFKVSAGADGRSIVILVPAIAAPKPAAPAVVPPPTGPLPPVVPMTPKEIEERAKALIGEGRAALAANDAAGAIDRLNQLLNLPPNAQSEEAQALIGNAREANGELAKARAEYELYLKLYPKGTAAAGIRERMARLAAAPAEVARPGERPEAPAQWMTFGSWSQNYYTGQSQIDTQNTPPGQTPTFSRLSATDQDALVSNLDLNARRRSDTTDTRIVLRDTHTANFLASRPDENRLNAAYIEQSHKTLGYLVRAGRQTGNAGGVLGRFDGLWAGYNFSPAWRVNVTAGSPVEAGVTTSPYSKRFYGGSIDYIAPPESWGGSVYIIQQTADGTLDRRAVGGEARYFDARRTFYGMLDYDTAFSEINIAMMQGNWQFDIGTNVFAIFDHRKSPPLSITQSMVVNTPTFSTFRDALAANGESTLRDQAKALTATSDLLMLGFTHPVTPRWQAGGDFRVSAISGTDAAGAQPAMPGSGNVFTYTAQVIGNGLYFSNDVGVVNGSHIQAPSYSGNTIGLSYVTLLNDKWRAEGSFRYYAQKDDQDVRMTRIAPTLRFTYRWRENFSFEGEYGYEDTDTRGPTLTDRSKRHYIYAGYRWDF